MKMGDSEPCDKSVFEVVGHKSCKNNPLYGQAFVEESQFNCRNKDDVDMDLLMENLDISDEVDLNALLLEEHENRHVKKTICSSTSTKNSLQVSTPNTTELKIVSKCAVILCSEALQSCPSIFAKVELSNIELGYESSAASKLTEDSLVPNNDSPKHVSALKGSRALHGKPLDSNLHVTWEADVYDPPVTSSSHTVKGHRHRLLRANILDHHKHNHMKARPSNACRSDRKHSHRRSSNSSILDTRMLRMQALARRSLQSGFELSNIQTLNIAAASDQESAKCAGSFHVESLWSLPLPIAEAS